MERADPARIAAGALSVATSKTAVPRRRPDVVRRPRLNALLDAAIGAKGTLLAAPAGYGKTTLVVDWLQSVDFGVAWLALDEWDGDLPAGTRGLAQAIDAGLGVELALGDERFWQPRSIATTMINAIAQSEEYAVLVLDDVHLVQASEPVMALLAILLERAPENLHVVMTSRTRPPIPALSRLIARREVTTIGVEDLAFTAREGRELLDSLGRAVSDDEAEMLHERSEGWAAALVLGATTAAAAIAGNGAVAGVNVGLSLAEYVQGEALTGVPEELRRFLRDVSLLPVWTPALCDELSGRRDSERLLHEAVARVLFVSQYADDPPMYRCHQLLRSLLMQQFRSEEPERYAEAGRTASAVLVRFGLLNEAADLLFELQAWEQAAELLETIAPRLIQQGQARGLADWIDRLPLEAQAARANLQVWRARASYKLQEFDEALHLIEDAVRSLRDAGDTHGLVEALFVRGETQRRKGYYDAALSTFREARTLLEFAGDDDLHLAGDALRNLGVTHTIMGELDAATDELEEARLVLEQVGDLQGIGNTCVSLAQCYARRGDQAQALASLQRAQSAFERAGNTFDLGLTLNNTGMLYYELGEYEQALQVYDRGLRLVRGAGARAYEQTILAGIAETYREMGRLQESLAVYEELGPMLATTQVPYLVAVITEGHALTRIALGEGEEAARLLWSVAPATADAPRTPQHRLAEAQLALARGDASLALGHVDAALRELAAADDRHGVAVAVFLRARALFEAHQPRKAMAELERVAAVCEELGYHRFLRSQAAAAPELVEYARIHHVAARLIGDLGGAQQQPAGAPGPASRRRGADPEMLPAVHALAFGRGSVLVGERQVADLEWRSEKSKEMFFFLLVRGEPVSKEEIFTALWPDLPESKCNSNFHSSLYRLRRALFHECVVRATDGAYGLNPRGRFDSDIDAFRQAMGEADAAREEDVRADRLAAAIALYRGRFLASTYSEWTEPLRRELEDRFVEALNELAAWKLSGGAFEEALMLFKSLEDIDPYSDAAAFGSMRCYIGLNDQGTAARHYRRYRQLLQDELDEEPSERLTALYREGAR
ncbi:MAG: tetratricopeptide repeat protein [Dehalococcoidia bacterium]|nr:tetratricopeptide repeat protein [Dehalococcoidia bacterium]